MAGIAVSRLISVEDIEQEHRMTQAQISDKLRIKHPASKGLSSMSIQKFCRKINIRRNCKLNKKEFMKEVFQ